MAKFTHYCYEWDDMLIDENSWEFSCCSCDWGDNQEEVDAIKEKHWAEFDKAKGITKEKL